MAYIVMYERFNGDRTQMNGGYGSHIVYPNKVFFNLDKANEYVMDSAIQDWYDDGDYVKWEYRRIGYNSGLSDAFGCIIMYVQDGSWTKIWVDYADAV